MTINDKVWTRIVTLIGRKTYLQPNLDTGGYGPDGREGQREEADLDKANLVSSELPNGKHAPALDLDMPVHLVPSSTPGKYHLYIDVEISWEKYEALLTGFYMAGLIEAGWYKNAMQDKRTYLRLPHVKKPKPEVVARNGTEPF